MFESIRKWWSDRGKPVVLYNTSLDDSEEEQSPQPLRPYVDPNNNDLFSVIYGEGANEERDGRMGIFSSIRNRANGKGKSWKDIVSDQSQYNAFNGPMYKEAMSYYDGKNANLPQNKRRVLDDIKSMVLENGEDNTNGANSYLNKRETMRLRGGTLPRWATIYPETAQIGKHTFIRNPEYLR